jgi:predicted nuclease of predicted toxin-antitoxin system
VKFLVDANLPPALAQWLAPEGYEAHHVSEFGMEAMPDREIWKPVGRISRRRNPPRCYFGDLLS